MAHGLSPEHEAETWAEYCLMEQARHDERRLYAQMEREGQIAWSMADCIEIDETGLNIVLAEFDEDDGYEECDPYEDIRSEVEAEERHQHELLEAYTAEMPLDEYIAQRIRHGWQLPGEPYSLDEQLSWEEEAQDASHEQTLLYNAPPALSILSTADRVNILTEIEKLARRDAIAAFDEAYPDLDP